MLRVNFLSLQLLCLIQLACKGDPDWSKNAIFVVVEIGDEPMDNLLADRMQTLTSSGVDGVIISNSYSLMRLKSSAGADSSKLDELLLLLAENELKVLVNVGNYLSNISSKFLNSTLIADIDDNEAYKIKNIFNELKHCITRLISKHNVNGFVGELTQILSMNSSFLEQFVRDVNGLLREWSANADGDDSRVFVFIVDDEYYFSKKSAFGNLTHVAFTPLHLSSSSHILQLLLPGIVIIENEGELEKFQQFIRLRSSDVFKDGSVVYIPFSDDVSIIKRELDGAIYYLLVNLQNYSNSIELKAVEEKLPESMEIVASSIREMTADSEKS